ncbi:MAG: cation:proton antiporter [Lentisphaeria bacterium]|nr:cation:proton antiporter [Lentisphaeria bacterium]
MSNSSFLILFIAFIAFMGLVPFLLRRLGIPSVISLLIVGMLIGPTGIGMDLISMLSRSLSFLGDPAVDKNIYATVTASHFSSLVDSLGSLGLMFLMALAGMEADFKLIKSVKSSVISLSILTFLLPAVAGYLLYSYYCPNELAGKLLYASLFASHSVGIVFPVIRELKMSRTKFGAAVLISTVITDIASIILLAVSVQIFRQNQNISHMIGKGTLSIFDHMDSSILGNSFMPVFLLIVLVYLVLSVFLVDRVGRKLLEIFTPGEDILITIILLIILAVVVIGELFGINLVVGAFIAGLGLARIVKREDMLLFRRFESIGYGFLIPFLFVSIGMKTDFSAFAEAGSWSIVLLTVVLLVGSKVLSGFLALRITGFSNAAGFTAGLMTVPQLSATLAAAAIGKDMGILNDTFFNAIIVLSIVTTLPIPNLVRLVVHKTGLSFPVVEDVSVPRVVKDDELL